jgi:hypothetical protein
MHGGHKLHPAVAGAKTVIFVVAAVELVQLYFHGTFSSQKNKKAQAKHFGLPALCLFYDDSPRGDLKKEYDNASPSKPNT